MASPLPPDRMSALERIHTRLEQEYRDCLALQAPNERRRQELEEEMDSVAKALDWARRQP